MLASVDQDGCGNPRYLLFDLINVGLDRLLSHIIGIISVLNCASRTLSHSHWLVAAQLKHVIEAVAAQTDIARQSTTATLRRATETACLIAAALVNDIDQALLQHFLRLTVTTVLLHGGIGEQTS